MGQNYSFSPDSHFLDQACLKIAKNLTINVYLASPESSKIYVLLYVARTPVKKQFLLKNNSSKPPNDLNFQYISLLFRTQILNQYIISLKLDRLQTITATFAILFTECPRSEDRMERFACPSPDFRGRYRCIDDRSLCDGFFDCPSREDENPEMCLFYKTVGCYQKN